jgi:hypothetical protein
MHNTNAKKKEAASAATFLTAEEIGMHFTSMCRGVGRDASYKKNVVFYMYACVLGCLV